MTCPSFQELAESPTLSFGKNGNQVDRKFLVAGTDLIAFCEYLCTGNSGFLANSVALPDCYLSDLKAAPHAGSEQSPIPNKSITDVLTQANSFKHWHVTATYTSNPIVKVWPTCMPKPTHRANTTLSVKIRASKEYKGFAARFTYWEKGSSGSGQRDLANRRPVDMPGRLIIPTMDVTVEWDHVSDPPVSTWAGLVGKSNVAAMMGFNAETLILDDFDMEDSMYLSTTNPYRYKMVAAFKFRWPGWNREFRENPAGWVRVLMSDGQPFYPPVTLSNMFL